jgi:tRNA 2-thiouridine synthesizing protein E
MRVDKDGYLVNKLAWTEVVCNELVNADGYQLNEERWVFIKDARIAYKSKKVPKSGAGLASAYNMELAEILILFPKTPVTLLCKWAGLDKPKNLGKA